MNFIFFITNLVHRVFITFWYMIAELFIFSLIYKSFVENGMPIIANILGVIFLLWLIMDLIITIFVKTGKSFYRYLINI
jgi:hypothetical protein